MNRRRFQIPVGWRETPTLRTPFIEKLRSDALVIPFAGVPGDHSYEVERVHGAPSLHIPEKAPTYDVSWPGGQWARHRRVGFKTQVVRLAQIPIGGRFLVELDAHRAQQCFFYKGTTHGILYSKDPWNVWTYCDEEPYIPHDDREASHWSIGVPTCPKCAAFKTAWVLMRVYPYEHKEIAVKKTDKEALERKRRAKMPTAFDRILDDDFLEKQTYKPEPERPPTPEFDPLAVYEVDPRELRLATARERNRRLKTAMREMKGR